VKEISADAHALLRTIATTYPRTIWLVDVDDTLTDTARMNTAASRSIVEVLAPMVGESKAAEVVEHLIATFQFMVSFHQSTTNEEKAFTADQRRMHEQFQSRIVNCQREIKSKWGVTKNFSREVMLKIAAEDSGVDLDPAQIQRCSDHYWDHVHSHALFFKNAIRLTKSIDQVGSPLYLITSSDARFTLKQNGQFDYDPAYSRSDKDVRMEGLRTSGLRYRKAFIGDPVDKPSEEFFENVYTEVEEDLRRPIEPDHLIILGDSYRADLETPITKTRAALAILYRRGQEEVLVEKERVVSVGDLGVVNDFVRQLGKDSSLN
jgi:FMN phosphatase YigB (HAD superfamily)